MDRSKVIQTGVSKLSDLRTPLGINLCRNSEIWSCWYTYVPQACSINRYATLVSPRSIWSFTCCEYSNADKRYFSNESIPLSRFCDIDWVLPLPALVPRKAAFSVGFRGM
ncbi:hypothetical protein SCLCIDRAFT_1216776 [Scleroderma citrinum Foug A]|uniref:Uncharacterized protein n=1 Tax=Scleroderma citrinum Foug A TaxID=1036808 RepID=A0A0C3DIF9_9AGAM|nr:hypothetical protein SCLCIDRAFT_1216776 [Scleroderma citrinum Foug A]